MSVREVTCMDCGVTFIAVGMELEHANDQDICGTCKWLRDIPDKHKRENLRDLLIRYAIIRK